VLFVADIWVPLTAVHCWLGTCLYRCASVLPRVLFWGLRAQPGVTQNRRGKQNWLCMCVWIFSEVLNAGFCCLQQWLVISPQSWFCSSLHSVQVGVLVRYCYLINVPIDVFDSRPQHLFPLSLVEPSVLWRCWLAVRKGIRPVKTEAVFDLLNLDSDS